MREDYFNLKEAAKAVGVGETSLQRIIKKVPSFPALRVGGSWVIKKKPFYAFFEDEGNCNMLYDMFPTLWIDYARIREDGKLYALHVMHRGTLQNILREEERNRMHKTHLEF